MTDRNSDTEQLLEPDLYDNLSFSDTPLDKQAFIKSDIYNGKCMWGIYDEEGNRMALTDNREFAFIIAKQNDFSPYSVH